MIWWGMAWTQTLTRWRFGVTLSLMSRPSAFLTIHDTHTSWWDGDKRDILLFLFLLQNDDEKVKKRALKGLREMHSHTHSHALSSSSISFLFLSFFSNKNVQVFGEGERKREMQQPRGCRCWLAQRWIKTDDWRLLGRAAPEPSNRGHRV